MGMTLEPFSTTWAIKISCTQFDTPKWLQIGSRISGRTNNHNLGRMIVAIGLDLYIERATQTLTGGTPSAVGSYSAADDAIERR